MILEKKQQTTNTWKITSMQLVESNKCKINLSLIVGDGTGRILFAGLVTY